ncbi:hypothetical protein ACNVED_07265 [Legionella sp. D16C41]|uniref:hypothetical protein n=1 Tax=Legionella sp. D16C41 TaxID=3402688 RepID=UPI003AF7245E
MYKKQIYILVSSFIYSQLVLAQWHCKAEDNAKQEWLAESSYQRSAVNKAMEACKKMSRSPETCRVFQGDCELFVNGESVRPAWQCTALDQMAKAWKSNFYPNSDDAALAAKAYCQQHSAFPNTCYVNLLTCKDSSILQD